MSVEVDKRLKLLAASFLFTSAYLCRTSLCALWMWILTEPMSGKIKSQWGHWNSTIFVLTNSVNVNLWKATIDSSNWRGQLKVSSKFRLNEAVLPTILTKCVLTVCRWSWWLYTESTLYYVMITIKIDQSNRYLENDVTMIQFYFNARSTHATISK